MNTVDHSLSMLKWYLVHAVIFPQKRISC